ncbi:MAG: hypothetical protein AAES65_04095 [Candidatus Thiodiazotropha sp. (ex. Lucinoma kazani)]
MFTLIGISSIHIIMGLHHGFAEPLSKPGLFVFTSVILSIEILAGVLGYKVKKKVGYIQDYLQGEKRDDGSFALICPGVAMFVFDFFFIVFGLLKNNLIAPFSIAYFLILAPFIFIQLKTVAVYLKLNYQVLGYGLCRDSCSNHSH